MYCLRVVPLGDEVPGECWDTPKMHRAMAKNNLTVGVMFRLQEIFERKVQEIASELGFKVILWQVRLQRKGTMHEERDRERRRDRGRMREEIMEDIEGGEQGERKESKGCTVWFFSLCCYYSYA